MDSISIILMALFCGFGGYGIGIARSKENFRSGFKAGRKSVVHDQNLRTFVEALDDIFADDEDPVTLDGGTY